MPTKSKTKEVKPTTIKKDLKKTMVSKTKVRKSKSSKPVFVKENASTVLNYSPQKTRLVIRAIKGRTLEEAFEILESMNKGKTKKIAHLLSNAANNLSLTESEYTGYFIKNIVAEEAQRLYRIRPRARGSAFRIRRRYSRIKVWLNQL